MAKLPSPPSTPSHFAWNVSAVNEHFEICFSILKYCIIWHCKPSILKLLRFSLALHDIIYCLINRINKLTNGFAFRYPNSTVLHDTKSPRSLNLCFNFVKIFSHRKWTSWQENMKWLILSTTPHFGQSGLCYIPNMKKLQSRHISVHYSKMERLEPYRCCARIW